MFQRKLSKTGISCTFFIKEKNIETVKGEHKSSPSASRSLEEEGSNMTRAEKFKVCVGTPAHRVPPPDAGIPEEMIAVILEAVSLRVVEMRERGKGTLE